MTGSDEKLLKADITREVIGAAMGGHRVLGQGCLESVCRKRLAHEMRAQGIRFAEQGEL